MVCLPPPECELCEYRDFFWLMHPCSPVSKSMGSSAAQKGQYRIIVNMQALELEHCVRNSVPQPRIPARLEEAIAPMLQGSYEN